MSYATGYITVSYKSKRGLDAEKDAEILKVAKRDPVKRHTLHPSTPEGTVESLVITKFAYANAKERDVLMKALAPLGDTRDMGDG